MFGVEYTDVIMLEKMMVEKADVNTKMTVEKQPLSKLQRDSGQRKERVLMAKRKGARAGWPPV